MSMAKFVSNSTPVMLYEIACSLRHFASIVLSQKPCTGLQLKMITMEKLSNQAITIHPKMRT